MPLGVRLLIPLGLVSTAALGADEPIRIRYNNPGLTVDLGVGLWAWPLPMDYDGDGDLDLVVSSGGVPYEGTYFFENDSPPSSRTAMPVFRPGVRIGEYRTNAQISHIDGREPVVMTPGQEHPQFLERAFSRPAALPLRVEDVHAARGRVRANQWKRIDWEADGDLDLVVGVGDWTEYGWDDAYDSAGNWTNGPLHGYVYLALNDGGGNYSQAVKVSAGGRPVDVYGMPSPSFADFDGDGDLDLICGEFLDGFTYFENVGTRRAPRYAAGRRLLSAGRPVAMDLQMITPTAVDWDRDGDMDLVAGDEDGRVAFVENLGRSAAGMPAFAQPQYFRQRAEFVKFGALATPVGFDWDGDGDEDIVAGNSAGYIGFIENLDGGSPPKFAAPVRLAAGGKTIRIQAGDNGSIQGPGEAKWGYTTISVADWDGDSLPDIVANSIWGRIVWHRNVGSRSKPVLEPARPVAVDWGGEPRRPAWNWWLPADNELVSQWRTRPVVTDWNRDGLQDIVMLDHEGYLAWFRRARRNGKLTLLPAQRIFFGAAESGFDRRHEIVDRTRGPLRLNADRAGKSGRRKIDLTDWDGDGAVDILVNSAAVDWLRNAGGENGRFLFQQKGALTSRRLAGHTTSPTTVDWDGNGARDLLIGAEDGFFYWLENPRIP